MLFRSLTFTTVDSTTLIKKTRDNNHNQHKQQKDFLFSCQCKQYNMYESPDTSDRKRHLRMKQYGSSIILKVLTLSSHFHILSVRFNSVKLRCICSFVLFIWAVVGTVSATVVDHDHLKTLFSSGLSSRFHDSVVM